MMTAIVVIKKMEMCGNKSQIHFAYRTSIIQHNATCIYNTAIIGITAVHHKHTRLSRLHGNVRFFSSIQKQKESFLTIVTCMSPTGHFIPPLLLFAEKNMKLEMMNGTPLVYVYICHLRSGAKACFSPSIFFIFLKTQTRKKKIL